MVVFPEPDGPATPITVIFIMTRLYEKSPPPNPRGADRGAHVRSSNL